VGNGAIGQLTISIAEFGADTKPQAAGQKSIGQLGNRTGDKKLIAAEICKTCLKLIRRNCQLINCKIVNIELRGISSAG
jgi:hypothetical protein